MAISDSTPVPTPTGWILARDLIESDYVFGLDGLPKRIRSIQHFTPDVTYVVEMSDGTGVIGDKRMTFPTETLLQRNKHADRRRREKEGRIRKKSFTPKSNPRSVESLLEVGLRYHADNRRSFSVPTVQPVAYSTIDYPVPPFVVGLWFATKRAKNRYAYNPSMFRDIEKKLRSLGYLPLPTKKHLKYPRMEIRPEIKYAFLTKYPSIPTTIPDEYFIGNSDQRLELLRGIVWGFGYVYKKATNKYRYSSVDQRFCRKLQGLCESLGIRTMLHAKDRYGQYALTFRTDLPIMPSMPDKTWVGTRERRMIASIEEQPAQPCVHIEVDGSYVVGEGYIAIC